MLCDLFAGWHIHRHVTYKISISTPRRSRGWEVEGDHGEWVKQLRDDQGSLQGAVIQWRTKKGSCNISWNLPFSCPGMFTQLHNREFRIECSRFLYISNACMYIIKVYRNHFQTRQTPFLDLIPFYLQIICSLATGTARYGIVLLPSTSRRGRAA